MNSFDYFFKDIECQDPHLQKKYQRAFNMCKQMLLDIPDQRPDCEEILNEKQFWALSENELDIKTKLRAVLDSNTTNENSFIYSFIESKLIDIHINDPELFQLLIDFFIKRPTYVHKTLLYLFDNYISIAWDQRKYIIDFIITIMRLHSELIDIQLAATAYLHFLTKNKKEMELCAKYNKLEENIDPKTQQYLIETIMKTMQKFPNNRNLNKNSLSILCSDCVLQQLSFDRCKCLKLVINSMVTFKDSEMVLLAFEVCSLVSTKMSINEKENLCAQSSCVKTLLNQVELRIQNPSDYDIVLEYILSTLSNICDDSPKTCESFISNGGLDKYMLVLNVRLARITQR
jgi:Zyg-11 family protein